ncbi:hypothetical protein DJ521_08370 [Sulfolobus sp. E3]|nr:hypothetical protein DJ521_08370 [Sulfolobus sp. E3]
MHPSNSLKEGKTYREVYSNLIDLDSRRIIYTKGTFELSGKPMSREEVLERLKGGVKNLISSLPLRSIETKVFNIDTGAEENIGSSEKA